MNKTIAISTADLRRLLEILREAADMYDHDVVVAMENEPGEVKRLKNKASRCRALMDRIKNS